RRATDGERIRDVAARGVSPRRPRREDPRRRHERVRAGRALPPPWTTPERAMNKRLDSGTFWAFVPVGLLGGLIATVLGLVHTALTDPGFAVQDRYYSRALSWDEHLAAERRSAALGWRAELAAVRVPSGMMDVT